MHRVHEFLRGKWLRDVRVRTKVESSVPHCIAALGGEHDDLYVPEDGVLADLLAHLEPASLRHHHVEQDHIRSETLGELQCFPAVERHPHFVVVSAHQEFERGDDVRLVVDDENPADDDLPASASGRLDQRKLARDRQGEREAGSLAGAARHPHAPAEVLDDPTADVQAQPAALRLAGKHVAHLSEFFEDDLLIRGSDADAIVAHLTAQKAALLRERYCNPSRRAPGKLGRIGQQIEHHLHQAIAVGDNTWYLLRQLYRHLDFPLLEQLTHRGDRVLEHFAHVDLAGMPLRGAGLYLGEVQHLVDEAGEPLGLLDDDPEKLRALALFEAGIVIEDFRERTDRSERRAQLVRHGGDEVVFQAVELLQSLVRAAQLVGRRLELPRFLLQLPAVRENLRGLVDDVHHLIDVQGFFLDDRGHHDAGRSAADGAGEERFCVVHQVGVGRERLDRSGAAAAGVGGKRLVRALRTEETAYQQQQAVDRGAAAPEARTGGRQRVLESIDEYGGLSVL